MNRRWFQEDRILGGAVCAVALAVFALVATLDFLPGDDRIVILENPHIRGFSSAHWKTWLTVPLTGHYEPVAWMAYAGLYQAFRLRPSAYHVCSLLIHAANAGLVFALCRALGARPNGERSANDSGVRAAAPALGGLFFAVHPLRVEAVAWASALPYLLAGFFALAGTLAYCRAARAGDPGWGMMAALLACFAASLFSVPIALALPAVWLMLDWRVLGRGWSRPRVWVEKAPFFALGAAVALITRLGKSWQGYEIFHKVLHVPDLHWTQSIAYGLIYPAQKTLLPWRLSPYTPLPEWLDLWRGALLLAWVGILGLAAALILFRNRFPGWVVALAATVALLSPLLAPFGSEPAADRYTYLAAVPLSVGLTGLMVRIRGRRRRMIVLAGSGAALALLIAVSQTQIGVWRSAENLCLRMKSVNPRNPFPHDLLGQIYLHEGRMEESIRSYRVALQLEETAGRHVNLGVLAAATGAGDKAAFHFRRALQLDPANESARANLSRMGRAMEALRDEP